MSKEAEKLAHDELSEKIVALMWEFTDKYAAPGSNLYPQCGRILVEVLAGCLEAAQSQALYAPQLTERQSAHIAAQIDNWYFYWKDKLWISPVEHRLGFAKEQLKGLLCPDTEVSR